MARAPPAPNQWPGYPPGYPPPGAAYPPFYPPGPFVPVPPPPKSESSALIVVVVVVILVALLVMVPVLYVLVTGLGPANTQTPPTAVLSGAGSWATSGGNTTYTFTVSTVSPSGAHVDPSDLQYVVSNSARTVLYSGAAGQNQTAGGYTINVLYQDNLDVGLVSVGDNIQIGVQPTAGNPLLGGQLQVIFNGASLATGDM